MIDDLPNPLLVLIFIIALLGACAPSIDDGDTIKTRNALRTQFFTSCVNQAKTDGHVSADVIYRCEKAAIHLVR
jgi:hypothetical protein